MGVLPKSRTDHLEPLTRDVRPRNGSNGHGLAIPGADEMKRVLSIERRRTERSGNPFLLMLFDVERAMQWDPTHTVLRRLWSCLAPSTRETDICGWYVDQAVLGVVYTEINTASSKPVEEVLRERVVTSLASQLSADELNLITISVHVYPDKWDNPDKDRPSTPQLYPDLPDQNPDKRVSQILKRTFDIVGSTSALILFSPLMLLIAVLAKLTSKGPVLFRQKRVGQYGIPFSFLKFRTMKPSSDPGIHKAYVSKFIAGGDVAKGSQLEPEKVYKIKNDPRVTPLGRFLRKFSLDELPQFWNVLRGDMSLVGPRPPIPYEVEFYDIWHRRRLLEVKPGITGLWQVYGRSRTQFNDMVRLDLEYARAWSLWLDVKILLMTPGAMISGDGAY